jgi:formate C-acetyltransferase
MSIAKDRLQVYNCDLLKDFLTSKNLPQDVVDRPAFTACCTPDVYLHSVREEYYLPTVQLFIDLLHKNKFTNKKDLLLAFKQAIKLDAEKYIQDSRDVGYDWASQVYLLDGLLLSTCNDVCQYPPYGLKYRVKNIFLPGIATLADSLAVIDKLVFNGDVSYDDLILALKDDFVGHQDLLLKIQSLDKFGNDKDVDAYATEIGNIMVDGVEESSHLANEVVIPSFYSLERDNSWASQIMATPDGRKSSTPISENQSPTYGNDKSGITALLNSISKIPFARTGGGGLNLTFLSKVDANILNALCTTYFNKGGIHCGITVLDRQTLKDAMVNPDKYKSLTVRLYGFSEYFICLPKFQQLAVLNRTGY